MRTALTDIFVKNAKPPVSGQKEFFDTKATRFCLRVSKGGTKSFCVYYEFGGRQRRYTVGRYPDISLSDARKLAAKVRSDAAFGEDPAAKKETPDAQRFDEVVESFMTTYSAHHNKPRTQHETGRLLRKEFVSKWANRNIRDITKQDVNAILDAKLKANAPATANHAFSAIRKLFNWAVQRGIVENTPLCRHEAARKSCEAATYAI